MRKRKNVCAEDRERGAEKERVKTRKSEVEERKRFKKEKELDQSSLAHMLALYLWANNL